MFFSWGAPSLNMSWRKISMCPATVNLWGGFFKWPFKRLLLIGCTFSKPLDPSLGVRFHVKHDEHGWIDQWQHILVLKCLVGGKRPFHTLRNSHAFLWIPIIDSFQISTLRDSRTAPQRKLPVHHNSLVYESTKDNQIIIWRTNIQNTIPNIHKGTFLKLTASFTPENRPKLTQKERRIVFQQSTFRCENVSFGECICWGGHTLRHDFIIECTTCFKGFIGERDPSQVLSNKLLCGIPLKTDPLQ